MSGSAARDPERGLGGHLPDATADPDDDVGLLGGRAVRRQLLMAHKLPRWLGPAATAVSLLLLLILASVALRRASEAQRASAAASLLSQALITDRLNQVGLGPALTQSEHLLNKSKGTSDHVKRTRCKACSAHCDELAS